MPAARLVAPDMIYKDSFLAALRDFHDKGQRLNLDYDQLDDEFEEFIMTLNDPELPNRGLPLWCDYVPERVLWLVMDGEYLGTVRIRKRLNWHLEHWGGHLSYILRPGYEDKGFGEKILRMAIPWFQYMGMRDILLTARVDDERFIRAIEAVGGELRDEEPETENYPARRRYWVGLQDDQ